jgi:hypothetical protein
LASVTRRRSADYAEAVLAFGDTASLIRPTFCPGTFARARGFLFTMLSPGDAMPALALVMILLSTSFGGWGAAQALPLAPASLGNGCSCALTIVPVRWRWYRYYRYRYDRDSDDDARRLLWRRGDEIYGRGSALAPFTTVVPPRRGRWVDPPPPE